MGFQTLYVKLLFLMQEINEQQEMLVSSLKTQTTGPTECFIVPQLTSSVHSILGKFENVQYWSNRRPNKGPQ